MSHMHTAAGWAEGAWAGHIAKGRHVQGGEMRASAGMHSVLHASVATNDSHNDFEGLLTEDTVATMVPTFNGRLSDSVTAPALAGDR